MSYAGGSVAARRISHAGQVEGHDPDKKGYSSPPGWWVGNGVNNPMPLKALIVETVLNM